MGEKTTAGHETSTRCTVNLTQRGTVLTMRVLDMPEDWRGRGELYANVKNGIMRQVASASVPQIVYNPGHRIKIYLRGDGRYADKRHTDFWCESEKETFSLLIQCMTMLGKVNQRSEKNDDLYITIGDETKENQIYAEIKKQPGGLFVQVKVPNKYLEKVEKIKDEKHTKILLARIPMNSRDKHETFNVFIAPGGTTISPREVIIGIQKFVTDSSVTLYYKPACNMVGFNEITLMKTVIYLIRAISKINHPRVKTTTIELQVQ